MQNSINSLEDIRKERQLREEIEDLLDKEELKWAQKARANWILYGDRNTKYFKTVVKQRRATNRILQLKDGDGNFTDNLNEIKNILLSHFKSNYEDCSSRSVNNILKELQPLNIPTLTDEQHFSLNKPILDFEIECAVFQLGAHKAPGPDGDGNFIDNLNEIENILLSHFKSNYEDCSSRSVDNILEELQPLNIPTLTHEQHFSLNKPISNFEIECAVFQLGA